MNEPAGFSGPIPMDVVFSDEEEITDHVRIWFGQERKKKWNNGWKVYIAMEQTAL